MSIEQQFSIYETRFMEVVRQLIEDREDSPLSIDAAMTRVAAAWLGYDIPNDNFVDGSGDRGIDFWYLGETELHIIQVKTHRPNGFILDKSNFGSQGVMDLSRARDFLLQVANQSTRLNNPLKYLVEEWQDLIKSRRLAQELENKVEQVTVSLNLLLIGGELTPQANEEYLAFSNSLKNPIQVDGIPINFNSRSKPFYFADLIEAQWQIDNQSWSDKAGNRKESIEIYPEQLDEHIISRGHALFYAKAYDLVEAYNKLGYRIFEPNVRAEVRRSKVNASIEESANSPKGRKIFKFLNNGITIVSIPSPIKLL